MHGNVRPWLSEEHFQVTVRLVEEHAIFLLDADGVIRTWNLGAERINGYRSDEIVGKHFRRLYTEEDVRHSKPELVLRTATEQGRFEEEGWRVHRDGTRFRACVAVTALHDDHLRLVGFTKVTRELRARRTRDDPEAHQKAANSTMLDSLLELTPEPALLTDLKGVALLATRAAERLFGVTPGFFARRPLINVVARQDTRSFRKLVDELARAPQAETHMANIRMRPRGGPMFIANVRATRFEGARGPGLYWILNLASWRAERSR